MYFPDIRLYNLASNARVLQDWFSNTATFTPITLDRTLCAPSSLVCRIHLPYTDLPQSLKDNPLFMSAWHSWIVIRRRRGSSPHCSLFLPFVDNPAFQHGKPHPVFRVWASRGLAKVGDLIETSSHSALTFSQACTKFPFIKDRFFHFLQLQSYAQRISRALGEGDNDDSFCTKLTVTVETRGLI